MIRKEKIKDRNENWEDYNVVNDWRWGYGQLQRG